MPKLVLDVKKLDQLFPKSMVASDRKLLLKVAQRSVAELNAGNKARAAQGAKIWAAALSKSKNNGDGTSPFESCGDKCQHHLDDGDPVAYGACYWACVIRGGAFQTGAASLTANVKAKAVSFIGKG